MVDIIVNIYTFTQKPFLITIYSFPYAKAVFLYCNNNRYFSLKVLPQLAKGCLITQLH